MINRVAMTTLTVCLMLPGIAQAQSFAERDGRVDRRAAISFTIPFGNTQNDDAKPRVELRMRQDQAEPSWRGTDRNFRPYKADQRIGFTLDKKPQLMLNGSAYKISDKKARIGTGGYIAIGAVVVLAIGALVLYQVADDASE